MATETVEKRSEIVREEFRVLLRAEAELHLPQEYEGICNFYRKTADSCMAWVRDAEGERLRQAYLALSDHTERARFRSERYALMVEPVWEMADHMAFLCRSCLYTASGETIERRMAQAWCLSEESILPPAQLLRLCRPRLRKRPPFRADGVYPQEGELVFYRNTGSGAGDEFRVPIA